LLKKRSRNDLFVIDDSDTESCTRAEAAVSSSQGWSLQDDNNDDSDDDAIAMQMGETEQTFTSRATKSLDTYHSRRLL
jgi:hypothetical protein